MRLVADGLSVKMIPAAILLGVAACANVQAVDVTTNAAALHSPFDADQRRAPTQPAPQSFACPATPTPVVRLATGSIYNPNDPNHAEIDIEAQADYLAEITPVRNYVRDVVKMANAYVRTGSVANERCALRWLKDWASAGGLTRMETVQGYLGRGSLLAGLSFALLQLDDQASLGGSRRAAIAPWLARMAEDTIQFVDKRPDANSSKGNHRYWNGLGVAVAGIVNQRRDLFDWGMASARVGIAQIGADGILPVELSRGKRARDYHLYALAPLIMLAELGAANGVDLYGENQSALQRLVRLVVTSIDDPSYIAQRAGAAQVPYPNGQRDPPSSRMAWLAPYLARFPDAALARRFGLQGPLSSTDLGGDLTLFFVPPQP
ncbi:MAG: alginate lyase family protein [Gammaproteobacteria bacterium]